MARRLGAAEELHLLVSPKSRPLHQDYGPGVRYITFPWSNERRSLRTLSEHLYSPVRLPLSRIDVLNTLMAPVVNLPWSLVLHMKTMHAYTDPEVDRAADPRVPPAAIPALGPGSRTAIIINSQSLRSEIEQYLAGRPAASSG